MAETSTKLGRVSLVPRGEYDPSAAYDRLDIVEYEGSGYLVLVDGTKGVTPADGPNYMLLVERGGPGQPGDRGPQGVPGAPGSPGADGAGIQSVQRTAGDGSPGTADTYTITLTNGTTSTFTVYNGADGTSFTVLGRYDTLAALKAAHPAGSEGDTGADGPQDEPGPKANEITVTLPASGWSNGTQTVNNAGLLAQGYGYIITPDGDSYAAYAACMVRADDVAADGEITFRCSDTPSGELTVNIMRIEVE